MMDVRLKEYLEELISAADRHVTAEWTSHRREHALLKEAIDTAYSVLNGRLEGMNEFRAQINAERGQYVTKSIYDERYERLVERIAGLEKYKSNMDGKLWMLGTGLMAVTILLNLLLRWLIK
jgi:hypothetical protein